MKIKNADGEWIDIHDIPTSPMSSQTHKVPMPGIGMICVAIGVISLLLGGFLFVGGLYDSANPHVNSAGEVQGGLALLLSSVLWFAIARGLTLLAQIAHNTSDQEIARMSVAEQPPHPPGAA